MHYQRLYIDVDGVINAMRHGSYSVTFIGDDCDGVRIRMNGGAVKEFLDCFDEVVWATSWVNYPNLLTMLEENIGVAGRGYERIELDKEYLLNTPLDSSGKDEGVTTHYDDNPAKSLWIDDDHGPLDREAVRGRDITLFTPDPMLGAYEFMANYVLPLR